MSAAAIIDIRTRQPWTPPVAPVRSLRLVTQNNPKDIPANQKLNLKTGLPLALRDRRELACLMTSMSPDISADMRDFWLRIADDVGCQKTPPPIPARTCILLPDPPTLPIDDRLAQLRRWAVAQFWSLWDVKPHPSPTRLYSPQNRRRTDYGQ